MWPTVIQQHLDAGKPMRHDWAFFARVKAFGTNTLTDKGVWTGDYDYSTTLDGVPRLYEGAMGGLIPGPIRYRTGTYIMTLDVDIALSDEGQNLVRGYNVKNAPCDLFCICFDLENMTYLGERRFFKGTIDGAQIVDGPQGEAARMTVTVVSVARKGTMTTTGKKSNTSQKARNAADRFREYSDLGRVSSDMWGSKDD